MHSRERLQRVKPRVMARYGVSKQTMNHLQFQIQYAEGVKYRSPGQGYASSASLAATLGHCTKRPIGRAIDIPFSQPFTEAETPVG